MTKRVNQRTDRDCMRAAVASAFELPYEEVPDFGNGDYDDEKSRGWRQECELAEWLALRGLGFLRLPNPWREGSGARRMPWGVCLGEGASPRGDFYHAVVFDARGAGGEEPAVLLHDPHPSRAGLRGPPDSFVCFTVDDPAKVV